MSDIIDKNLSFGNPDDLAYMKKQGTFNGEMTVGQYLEKALSQAGISMDDPVQKLTEFGKAQIQNANPMGKMRNIAGSTGNMPMRGVEPQPTAPGGGSPGIEGLLKNI